MKTRLSAALATNLNPAFFGLACLLLISVLLTAKVIADQLGAAEDRSSQVFAIPNHYPWLAVN